MLINACCKFFWACYIEVVTIIVLNLYLCFGGVDYTNRTEWVGLVRFGSVLYQKNIN